MNSLFNWVAKNKNLRKAVPPWLRRLARKSSVIYRYNQFQWRADNPYYGTPTEWHYTGSTGKRIGIVFSLQHDHRNFMAACQEMGISYEVVDIFCDDWIEKIKQSNCEVFVAWPTVATTLWKEIFDERIYTLVNFLGKKVYPTLPEFWAYESKRRERDWFVIHNIEHPTTWVFTDEDEALNFVEKCDLPIVFKTNTGASSKGVLILRDRSKIRKLVQKTFKYGFVVERGDPRDRQWGVVIFQQYLPNAKEWRMVRIGDAYFCRIKGKAGDFHSGSGSLIWGDPPRYLLDRIRKITTDAGYTSMNIDFFETEDGKFVVNEMHTVFGGNPVCGNEKMKGRFLYNQETDQWNFEPGDFYRNACANARIEYVLQTMLKD